MDIPNFDFNASIPGPMEMGVRSKGNKGKHLDQIGKNAGAVSGYLDMVIGGTPSDFTRNLMGESSRNIIRPLGGRFFIDTITKCKYDNPETGLQEEVNKSMYMDMVPKGNSLGVEVSQKLRDSGFDTRGIIPGVMEDVQALNPIGLLEAAINGNNTKCIKVQGIVNEKQQDGSLNPNGKHPDIQYIGNEPDWEYMKDVCSREYPGLTCETRYVTTENQPCFTLSGTNANCNNVAIEDFSNIETIINENSITMILKILLLLVTLIIGFYIMNYYLK